MQRVLNAVARVCVCQSVSNVVSVTETKTCKNLSVTDFSTQQHAERAVLKPIRLSVHPNFDLSVTRMDHSKTVEVTIIQFLADSTNGHAIATVLCLSSSSVVCDVMYCG